MHFDLGQVSNNIARNIPPTRFHDIIPGIKEGLYRLDNVIPVLRL